MDAVHAADQLKRTPATLSSLVESLPSDALSFREEPDAWTIPEVVCHLADGEITDWMPRVRRILSDQSDTPFVPYDREGGFDRYAGWPMSQVLEEFARLRRQNLEELARLQIGPEALERIGIHPGLGLVTLNQLLATWVTHDLAHLAQASRIMVRYFGQGIGPWKAYFSLLKERP